MLCKYCGSDQLTLLSETDIEQEWQCECEAWFKTKKRVADSISIAVCDFCHQSKAVTMKSMWFSCQECNFKFKKRR